MEPAAPPSPSFGSRLGMDTAGPASPESAAEGGDDDPFGLIGRAADLLPRLTCLHDPFWSVRVGGAPHPGPYEAGRNRRTRKLKAVVIADAIISQGCTRGSSDISYGTTVSSWQNYHLPRACYAL